jgi:hypothetical protein
MCALDGVGDWLTDILGRISDHKINNIDELLSWNIASGTEPK